MKVLKLIILAVILLSAPGCAGDHGVGYNSTMDWIDQKTNDLWEWRREQRLKRLMRQQDEIDSNWLQEIRDET